MTIKYQIHEAHDLHVHVHYALSKSPFLVRDKIDFEIEDQDVVLKGSVKTYYQKQMAQESLRKISGVTRILNQLSVVGR